MYETPGHWIFDRANSETIVLAVIGLIVPLAFQIYLYWMLKRKARLDRGLEYEIAVLLKELRDERAAKRSEMRDENGSSR